MHRLGEPAAVEFHDLRADLPHPVKVGVASTEIIERQQAAALTKLGYRPTKVSIVGHRIFQHLNHQLLRRQAPALQLPFKLRQTTITAGTQEALGIQIEEQPVVVLALTGKGRQVEGAQLLIQPLAIRAISAAVKQLGRR